MRSYLQLWHERGTNIQKQTILFCVHSCINNHYGQNRTKETTWVTINEYLHSIYIVLAHMHEEDMSALISNKPIKRN